MANTLLSVELLTDLITKGLPNQTVLGDSGIVVVKTGMSEVTAGTPVSVPYFGDLGEADLITTEGNEGSLTNIVETKEVTATKHAFKAVSLNEIERNNPTDPEAAASAQILSSFKRRFETELLSAAVAATAPSGFNAPYSKDVFSATTPVGLSWDLIVDGIVGLDAADDIGALMVHTSQLGVLLKTKDGEGRPLFTQVNGKTVLAPLGVPVLHSPKLPIAVVSSTNKYTSFLVRKGALTLWTNESPIIKSDENIMSNVRRLAAHLYFVAHRYGAMPNSDSCGVALLKHN